MPDLAELNLVINSSSVATANQRLSLFVSVSQQVSSVTNNVTNNITRQAAATRTLNTGYNSLLGVLTKIVGVYSLWRAATQTIEGGAQLQKTIAGFTTLAGSVDKANELVKEFNEISGASGFSSAAVNDAGRLYLALGGSAKTAARDVRTVTEAVTAMGGEERWIERIILQLGQMRAKGFLSGEEMKTLANNNVRAWEYVATAMGKSVSEVMKLAEKKQVDVSASLNAILGGLQRDFQGAFEHRAMTTAGAFDILVTKAKLARDQFGMEILAMPGLAEFVTSLIPKVEKLGHVATDTIRIFAGLSPKFADTADASETLAYGLQSILVAAEMLLAIKMTSWIIGVAENLFALNTQLSTVLPLLLALSAYFYAFDAGDFLKQLDEIQVILANMAYGAQATAIAMKAMTFQISGVELTKQKKDLDDWYDTFVKITVADKNYNHDATIKDMPAFLAGKTKEMLSSIASAVGLLDPNALQKALGPKRNDYPNLFGQSDQLMDLTKKLGEYSRMNERIIDQNQQLEEENWFSSLGGKLDESGKKLIRYQNELRQLESLLETTPVNAAGWDSLLAMYTKLNAQVAKLNENLGRQAYLKNLNQFQNSGALSSSANKYRMMGLGSDTAQKLVQAEDELAQFYDRNSAEFSSMMATITQAASVDELRQKFEDIANTIGDSFSKNFEDVIFGAKSAKDALRDFLQTVSRQVFNQLITQPISNAIAGGAGNLFSAMLGGTSSARGNVFGGGSVVPFANGGVPGLVNEPTYFPMSSGRWGQMGEAGPEAIMPLRRDASGRLGVAGGNGDKITNVTMNITTKDEDSFRRSDTQMRRRLKDL